MKQWKAYAYLESLVKLSSAPSTGMAHVRKKTKKRASNLCFSQLDMMIYCPRASNLCFSQLDRYTGQVHEDDARAEEEAAAAEKKTTRIPMHGK